jgi:hypothetical protein
MMKKIIKFYRNNPSIIVVSIGLAVIILPISMPLLVSALGGSEPVGANIGAGIGFMFGVPFIFFGLIWYGLTLKGFRKIIPILIVAALTLSWSVHSAKQEYRNSRIYCEHKLERNEEPIEGPEYCLEYL